MNVYRHHFYGTCPNNGVRISYTLTIETPDDQSIMVETILATTESFDAFFHEEVADLLARNLPGTHTLEAEHHGVSIKTTRQGRSFE